MAPAGGFAYGSGMTLKPHDRDQATLAPKTIAINGPTTDSQTCPHHGGSDGPGSAGEQPGGTEGAPGGRAEGTPPASSPSLSSVNPPLTKPSRKCTPLERFSSKWGWPPPLTGGPETQSRDTYGLERVAVSVDWLQGTGPLSILSGVQRIIAQIWGPDQRPKRSAALEGYEITERYPCGVSVSYSVNIEPDPADDDGGDVGPRRKVRNEGIWLVVPGHALTTIGNDGQYRLAYQLLQIGLNPTRVDLALDTIWAEPTDLLDCMYDGSRGLEQVDAKKTKRRQIDDRVAWQPEAMGFQTLRQMDTHKRGERRGRTLYWGSKGKTGGGRELCVYDKGAESGEAEPGHWIRTEIRFYKRSEYALQSLEQIASSPDGWKQIALDLVLSQIDFREANGRRERSRRTQCAWWNKFLRAVRYEAVISLESRRPDSTLATKIDWMQRCVAPGVTEIRDALVRAGATALDIGRVFAAMLYEDNMTDEGAADALHIEILAALREGDESSPAVMLARLLGVPHGPRRPGA